MLADLPTDSSVVSAVHANIPAGTYTALEAALEPAHGHDGSAAAFLAGNPTWAGVSVRVTGTYNGQTFVYSGAPQVHLDPIDYFFEITARNREAAHVVG